MSEGNSANPDLIFHIQTARDALDAALELLNGGSAPTKKPAAKAQSAPRQNAGTLDFTMPLRAFVKKYASSLNGTKKFTLLLAYLSGGDASKTVNLADIETHWNRMTAKGLLGMKFNRLYSSEARDNDWASTEKSGVYRLRPSWKAILNA